MAVDRESRPVCTDGADRNRLHPGGRAAACRRCFASSSWSSPRPLDVRRWSTARCSARRRPGRRRGRCCRETGLGVTHRVRRDGRSAMRVEALGWRRVRAPAGDPHRAGNRGGRAGRLQPFIGSTSADPRVDPFFNNRAFSFKQGCPSVFDCRGRADCEPAIRSTASIIRSIISPAISISFRRGAARFRRRSAIPTGPSRSRPIRP